MGAGYRSPQKIQELTKERKDGDEDKEERGTKRSLLSFSQLHGTKLDLLGRSN